MDDERAPAHVGVILLLDEADGFDLAHARQVLAQRVARSATAAAAAGQDLVRVWWADLG